MKLKLSKEEVRFLQRIIDRNSHAIISQGQVWFYFPYWFHLDAEDDTYEEVNFDYLPEHVKETIRKEREPKPDARLNPQNLH